MKTENTTTRNIGITTMSLDVDAPEHVSAVLNRAATAYYESAGILESAWQDPNAGKVWEKIALILEKAATQIDKIV
jgi:hypothetical protein